jgi:hypothetical protein
MKKIKESAILFEGKVYTGKRHHNVIQRIIADTDVKRVGAQWPQGFVTEDGEFVDREEAAKIALASGQVVTGKATVQHVFNGHTLYSEDLY